MSDGEGNQDNLHTADLSLSQSQEPIARNPPPTPKARKLPQLNTRVCEVCQRPLIGQERKYCSGHRGGGAAARARTATELHRLVYEAWIEATGRDPKRHKLTPDRIAAIERGRKRGYDQQDLIDAARGIALSPFHMGANDRDRPYNDLFHVFKTDANLERFRDLAQGVATHQPTNDVDRRVLGIIRGTGV